MWSCPFSGAAYPLGDRVVGALTREACSPVRSEAVREVSTSDGLSDTLQSGEEMQRTVAEADLVVAGRRGGRAQVCESARDESASGVAQGEAVPNLTAEHSAAIGASNLPRYWSDPVMMLVDDVGQLTWSHPPTLTKGLRQVGHRLAPAAAICSSSSCTATVHAHGLGE